MKDKYVKIKLSDIVAIQNEVAMLRARLAVYEPPQSKVTLLNSDGSPKQQRKTVHPFFKPGSRGLLDDMPDSFTYDDVCRRREGRDSRHAINVWKNRGYVTVDSEGVIHKTELFLKRMEQTRLVPIPDAMITDITEHYHKKQNNENE